MHGNRIYRAQLPDPVVVELAQRYLIGDLTCHIWSGDTCGDPGWVYLDHIALNKLIYEGVVVQHVSMFLNLDPTQNKWHILNPMEPRA